MFKRVLPLEYSMKICIIKLGAKGDVVRTLCILPALKKKFPKSEITWITKDNIKQIFEGNLYVNELLTIPCSVNKKFDILYNFDIEDDATILAKEIKADKKYGFYSENGYAMAFNLGAEYYINTMFDDELKKNNRKTYQEMMFEAAELDYEKEWCGVYLNEKDKKYAIEFVEKNGIKEKLIGIHMGAGSRWPSKAWHPDRIKEFVIQVKKKGFGVLLFGGPNEIESHAELVDELKRENIKVYQNNPNNTDKEFASLIDLCYFIVCSDSYALHIALALKKKTIGLFFCTSPWEVEGYGLLTKVISPILKDFFPERSDEYNEELVKSIKVNDVINLINNKE